MLGRDPNLIHISNIGRRFAEPFSALRRQSQAPDRKLTSGYAFGLLEWLHQFARPRSRQTRLLVAPGSMDADRSDFLGLVDPSY